MIAVNQTNRERKSERLGHLSSYMNLFTWEDKRRGGGEVKGEMPNHS